MKFKTFLFAVIYSLCFFSAYAQDKNIQIACSVDERVELMSVVFRLAGAKEYVTDDIPVYTFKIDSVFAKFAQEPVVKMSQTMRRNFGVGYDAVAALAVNLNIKDGEISLRKDINPCEIDERWQCDSIGKYITLLNDFYKKSDFNLFFNNHKKYYEVAETNFKENVLAGIKFEWYEKFYGEKPSEKFNVIISIANGPSNYGPHIKTNDGKEELFAIIGSWQPDSLGFPTFSRGFRDVVIHEFNHSFCNRLVSENLSKLIPKAKIFNDLVIDKMHAMAYGYVNTYLCELLVRACMIRYGVYNLGSNGSVDIWVAQERDNGFLWIPELNNALTVYENNRDKYPSLRSFMPEIVKVQNGLNPKKIYKQFLKNQPVILGTNIKNGAQDVDPNITQIIIKFDKPMNEYCNGTSYGKKGGEFYARKY